MVERGKPGRHHAPPPPRYARGWCPVCRWWLEAQFIHPPMPDKLVCLHCMKGATCASAGHCPLKGSHQALAVWEDK